MTVELVIPGTPPSLNTFGSGGNHWTYQKHKHVTKELVYALWAYPATRRVAA